MPDSLEKIIQGYQLFREKYVIGNNSFMRELSEQGQRPKIMIVACCDSRVDPALLLQCDPGDLFVLRNVANIVPPYENDEAHHGTSAALEFGLCYLNIQHLIILGHSQCGGIDASLNRQYLAHDDFISNWTNLIDIGDNVIHDVDECAKLSLINSYKNCLTFPWIRSALKEKKLTIHLWFFNIKEGVIYAYDQAANDFIVLK